MGLKRTSNCCSCALAGLELKQAERAGLGIVLVRVPAGRQTCYPKPLLIECLLESENGPPDWLFMGFTFSDEDQRSLVVVQGHAVEQVLKSIQSDSRSHAPKTAPSCDHLTDQSKR